MPRFDSDGVDIAYEVEGEGPPIVLVHGFAAGIAMNWKVTGWFEALTAVPYRRYKQVVLDFLSERGGRVATGRRMPKE